MTNRTVLVRLRAETSQFERGIVGAAGSLRTLRREIDTTNDRTAWLAQGLLSLGPALVPLGAAGVPVLAGLATQMGLAAGAAGTAALAFSGVGDALKALDDFQLEPTAENLEQMQQALAKIGPDGAEFVRFLDEAEPKFAALQMAAREGLFPGMQEGVESFVQLLPRVREVVSGIAQGMGELSASAGAGIAGPKFEEFFDYLERDAKPLLLDMGHTIGNFVEGFAAMAVAFAPLSESFSSGLRDMSESFAEWAQGLDESDSFAQFLAYVEEAGPKVLDLFGSLVTMFVQLAQAAAPVGDVLLPALTALADVVGVLADTPLGPTFIAAAAAMSAYGRAAALASITTAGLGKVIGSTFQAGKIKAGADAFLTVTSAQDRAAMSATALASAEEKRTSAQRAGFAQIGRNAAALSGLAVMTTGAADSIGLTNTASLALLGTLGGPWGVAVGGAVGFAMDLAAANDNLEAAVRGADSAIRDMDLQAIKARREELERLMEAQHPNLRNLDFGTGFDALAGLWSDASGATDKAKASYDELGEAQAEIESGGIIAGDATQYLSRAMDQAAGAAKEEALAIQGAIAAMRAKREEALRGLNAEINYKASLLDARDALKENGATVNENTRAGQENLRTLYATAAAWNGQSAAAKNAKGALAEARDNFIATADAMGMPIKQAEKLANRLFEIPSRRVIHVEAETGQAMSLLQQLQNFKFRDKYIRVHTVRSDSSGVDYMHGGQGGLAAGGRVVALGAPRLVAA